MNDYYNLDVDGNPVKVQFGEWRFGEPAERMVDRTVIPDPNAADGEVTVSTVFLGIDHAFGAGPPLIYETLVFGGALDDEMDRYSTREEAIAGHHAMVERVKAAS